MRVHNFFSKHRSSILLVVILLFSFISIFISVGSINIKTREAGASFFSLFQIGVTKVSTFFTGTITSISELKKLRSRYRLLTDKVADYQILQRDVIELRLENQRLREQLGYAKAIKEKSVSAQIIAQQPGILFKTMVIDKGSRKGIRKNMPVVAFQNGFQGLVGRIIEVTAFTSKVLPVFSRNSYVGARMLKSRYEGLVNGEGEKYGFLVMNYVKKQAKEEVKFGDIVVTSGIKSLYPPGLYIGRVREMETPEWQPSLQLKLEPIIDFSKLEYVFILEGGKR